MKSKLIVLKGDSMFNLYRIAAVSPEVRPADIGFNFQSMLDNYRSAVSNGASLVLFPELALSGKSCQSLFKVPELLKQVLVSAENFAEETTSVPAVFGMPLLCGNKLFDVAAVAQNGQITAFVCRNAPDESFFASGDIAAAAELLPEGSVFSDGKFTFSVNFFGSSGKPKTANCHLFCGAVPEIPGSAAVRENFALNLSYFDRCAVAMSFANSGESTTDNVYGGTRLVSCSGKIVAGSSAANFEPGTVYADIDLEKIIAAQLDLAVSQTVPAQALDEIPESENMEFLYNPATPFMPDDPIEKEKLCRESFALQCEGLSQRFLRCHAQSMVIGISGGLDSTLALVVMAMCCKKLSLTMDKIIAVTMPGFGTTSRTKNNALLLAQNLGTTIREISIHDACCQHFRDIGHDETVHNSVYENSQARERTQILMDIANQTNGIVVGTGDLSEVALGWSTFNGDQMAMYNVNSSIPKSNIACMLESAAKIFPESEAILRDVIDTPVSPELLPPDENGEINQCTENILGAYELHDYILYHFLSGIGSQRKLLAMAEAAFGEKYPAEELQRVTGIFFRRFFTQQFKRTAAPDGVQAGVCSLSARSAFPMPADLSITGWK